MVNLVCEIIGFGLSCLMFRWLYPGFGIDNFQEQWAAGTTRTIVFAKDRSGILSESGELCGTSPAEGHCN